MLIKNVNAFHFKNRIAAKLFIYNHVNGLDYNANSYNQHRKKRRKTKFANKMKNQQKLAAKKNYTRIFGILEKHQLC